MEATKHPPLSSFPSPVMFYISSCTKSTLLSTVPVPLCSSRGTKLAAGSSLAPVPFPSLATPENYKICLMPCMLLFIAAVNIILKNQEAQHNNFSVSNVHVLEKINIFYFKFNPVPNLFPLFWYLRLTWGFKKLYK